VATQHLQARGNATGAPLQTLTPVEERAAFLCAEDRLTDAEIASEVGISLATLYRWKNRPSFRARFDAYVEELTALVMVRGLADRRRRIAAVVQRFRDIDTVFQERARWFKEHEPAVPGGKTGLLVRRVKLDAAGGEHPEYEIDVAAVKEQRALLEHIAREKGEWVEKRTTLNANIDLGDDDVPPDLLERLRDALTGRSARPALPVVEGEAKEVTVEGNDGG
jgi:AcrR family transcriptional regulator